MKTNPLITDILRGPWLVNPAVVPEYEKLVNLFTTGQYQGTEIKRSEILAAASAPSSSLGQPQKEKRIGTITMHGVIPAYGDMCILGADDYLDIFRALNNNDDVSAIVIKMDVAGSSVSAINMMKEFASEKRKPVITLANTCFSGGYWTAALLSDYIMAYGDISAEFGSIGVLTMVGDGRKAMEKQGFKVMIIRAPQSTTKAQSMVDFYDGNDEAMIAELQREMKPMADAFINAVKTLRPNIDESAEGIFTGSTYNANEALKIGLIDGIGDEKQAYAIAQAFADLQNNS